MMTFLVVGDFAWNATLLDPKRRFKQVVEAKQIIDTILSGAVSGAWVNHPAVKAWRPYVMALQYYYNCMLAEFLHQGGSTKMPFYSLPAVISMPWWASWDRLHQSHRAMLIRKDRFFYSQQFPIDPEYMNYGYIWPEVTVSYLTRDAPLAEITTPIPPELINPVYCQGRLKSGTRKGQLCHQLVKPSSMKKAEREHFLMVGRYTHPFCGVHRRIKS